MGALTAASPPGRRAAVLAGMTGAALPDADKPTTVWFGWSPFPAAVDRFHARIQDESFHRAPVELAAAGLFAATALAAIRRARRGRDSAYSGPDFTAGSAGRPGRRDRRG
jgi:hypothetical protein